MELTNSINNLLTKPKTYRVKWRTVDTEVYMSRDFTAEDHTKLAKRVNDKIYKNPTSWGDTATITTVLQANRIKGALEEVLEMSENGIKIMGEKFGYAKIESLIEGVENIPTAVQNKLVEVALNPAITATNNLQTTANQTAYNQAVSFKNNLQGSYDESLTEYEF